MLIYDWIWKTKIPEIVFESVYMHNKNCDLLPTFEVTRSIYVLDALHDFFDKGGTFCHSSFDFSETHYKHALH